LYPRTPGSRRWCNFHLGNELLDGILSRLDSEESTFQIRRNKIKTTRRQIRFHPAAKNSLNITGQKTPRFSQLYRAKGSVQRNTEHCEIKSDNFTIALATFGNPNAGIEPVEGLRGKRENPVQETFPPSYKPCPPASPCFL